MTGVRVPGPAGSRARDLEDMNEFNAMMRERALQVGEKAARIMPGEQVVSRVAAMELAWLDHLAAGGPPDQDGARALFEATTTDFRFWYGLWVAAR